MFTFRFSTEFSKQQEKNGYILNSTPPMEWGERINYTFFVLSIYRQH